MPILRVLFSLVLLFSMALSACGGGSDAAAPPGNQPPPPGGGSGGQVNEPVVLTVTAGGTTSGVNINVPQKSGGEPNAELLGVTPVGEGGSAQNTGASVRRGQTMRVILFGTGLSGDMTVRVGGPDDIQVSNVEGITSTSGKSGIAFQVAVSSNAALGARTVFLRKDTNITAFAGGLEVRP
jgi:hypothetical protein